MNPHNQEANLLIDRVLLPEVYWQHFTDTHLELSVAGVFSPTVRLSLIHPYS